MVADKIRVFRGSIEGGIHEGFLLASSNVHERKGETGHQPSRRARGLSIFQSRPPITGSEMRHPIHFPQK